MCETEAGFSLGVECFGEWGRKCTTKSQLSKTRKKKVQNLYSKQNAVPAEQENLACLDFL